MTVSGQHDVVASRTFDVPVEQAWEAWVQPELVMQWWGPLGFTCPLARMDVREGGASLVCMRAPVAFGGQEIFNAWTYSVVEPLRRLEYVLEFTDADGTVVEPTAVGLPAGIPREVPHVITFDALGDGRTRVTVTEHGYATADDASVSEAGLEQCLDKMTSALRPRNPSPR